MAISDDALTISDDDLYDALTDEPAEPEEDDYILAPAGQLGARTAVFVRGGGFLGEFSPEHYPCKEFPGIETDEDAALTFIRERMKRDNFFPNVWRQDDHGGYTLLTVED